MSNDRAEDNVVTFLTRQGFHVVEAEDEDFRRILVVNGCLMMVRSSHPLILRPPLLFQWRNPAIYSYGPDPESGLPSPGCPG
jgi:hypothetical protein